MAYSKTSTIICLLVVLTAAPIVSQDFHFSGPVDEGFFPIGWSEDGTRFAYGWFATQRMITNGSQLTVIVQDLVTDEVLWQGGETWEESNVGGPGGGAVAPMKAPAAWQQLSGAIHEQLAIHAITRPDSGGGLHTFPMENGDSIQVYFDVWEREGLVGYQVRAFSRNRGEKRISGESFDPGATVSREEGALSVTARPYDPEIEIRVRGYVLNAHGTRMAVILSMITSPGRHYPVFQAIGCHLHAGFKTVNR